MLLSFLLCAQYDALATHYKFVTILVYIVMFVVEAARLYLAYEGNLREKVCTHGIPTANGTMQRLEIVF